MREESRGEPRRGERGEGRGEREESKTKTIMQDGYMTQILDDLD